jgi:hypothetical protein
MLAAGNCKLLATQAGTSSVSAAGAVGHTFAVSLTPQTITFNTLPAVTYGIAPFAISASTTAHGLTVNLASTTPLVCTLSHSASPATVTVIASGSCTIQATQPGNSSSYAAATPVTRSFNVDKKAQSITFNTISDQLVGAVGVPLTATSTAGLPVTITSQSTSICTVAGTATVAGTGYTATMLAVGNCKLLATQTGTSGVSAAGAVGHTFDVAAK